MDALASGIYNLINASRPKSIFDVVPEKFFLERAEEQHSYITGGNYYEWKYAVAKALQPTSILEIGVRFGYSLASFLMASPATTYAEGWDGCVYILESNDKATVNLAQLKDHGCNAKVVLKKLLSQNVKELDRPFDLVHIDGSHDYNICLSDLRLCLGKSKWIMVDDVDSCPSDRKACEVFFRENPQSIKAQIHIPHYQGSILFVMS